MAGGQSSAAVGKILRGARGTLGVRVFGLLVGYSSSVLLARVLGAGDFGAYRYALGWANLLTVIACLRADVLVVREVASAPGHSASPLVRFARNLTFVTATATVLIAGALVALFDALRPESLELTVFWLALGVLVATSLATVYRGALEARGAVVRAQWPDVVLRQGGLLLALGVALLLGVPMTAGSAMAFHVLAGFAALAGLGWMWRRTRAEAPPRPDAPAPRLSTWLIAAAPMTMAALLASVNTQADLILLGVFASREEVGQYAVAVRLANLVSYVLIAANIPLRPVVARLWKEGKVEALQSTLSGVCARVLVVAALIAAGLIALGPLLLGVFGPDFVVAADALRVLTAAQLLSAIAGPVGIVLMMSGHERATFVGLAVGAVTNVGLNALLIPRYGILGAAMATATGVFVWNAVLLVALRKRTGLHSTAWGAWRR